MSTPVPAQRLRALNSGSAAATHLAECLAVDFAALLQVVAPALEPEALQCMRDASGKGITQRMALAARLLHEAGQGILRVGRRMSQTRCAAGPAT